MCFHIYKALDLISQMNLEFSYFEVCLFIRKNIHNFSRSHPKPMKLFFFLDRLQWLQFLVLWKIQREIAHYVNTIRKLQHIPIHHLITMAILTTKNEIKTEMRVEQAVLPVGKNRTRKISLATKENRHSTSTV
jgi:hypothetical protein